MLASSMEQPAARLDPNGEAMVGESSESVVDPTLFEVLAEPRVLVFRVFLEVAAFAFAGFSGFEVPAAAFAWAASRCSARVLRIRGRL